MRVQMKLKRIAVGFVIASISVGVEGLAHACHRPPVPDGICVDFVNTEADAVLDAYGSALYDLGGGLTLTVSGGAFRGGVTDGVAHRGTLELWNYGYGVNNSAGDNSHTVDNQGWVDFIRFDFSAPVIPSAVNLSSEGRWGRDTDIDAMLGNGSPDVFGYTPVQLASSSDWNYLGTDFGGWDSRIALFNENELTGDSLLIVARMQDPCDDVNFKLRGICYQPAQPPYTPPPSVPDSGATAAMLGLALTGLGALRRRMG